MTTAREHAVRLSVIGAVKKYVGQLETEAKAEAAEAFGPGDRITAMTEDGTVVGTVSMTKGSPAGWVVTNRKAFLEWVRKTRPSAIVVEESVRESDERHILSQIEETGLVPDGVDVSLPTKGNLSVRPDHDVVRGLDWRRYLELGAAPATPVVERMPGNGPCEICGDPADHDGRPHGEATGDGRTRADLDPEPEDPNACPAKTQWNGPSSDKEHVHRCELERHRDNERHRCACGSSWLTREAS